MSGWSNDGLRFMMERNGCKNVSREIRHSFLSCEFVLHHTSLSTIISYLLISDFITTVLAFFVQVYLSIKLTFKQASKVHKNDTVIKDQKNVEIVEEIIVENKKTK